MKLRKDGRFDVTEADFRAMLDDRRRQIERVKAEAEAADSESVRKAQMKFIQSLKGSVETIERTMKQKGWNP